MDEMNGFAVSVGSCSHFDSITLSLDSTPRASFPSLFLSERCRRLLRALSLLVAIAFATACFLLVSVIGYPQICSNGASASEPTRTNTLQYSNMYIIIPDPTLSQNVFQNGDLNASYALETHRTLTAVELRSGVPSLSRSVLRHIPLHNTFFGLADARNECSIAACTTSAMSLPRSSAILSEIIGAESDANAYVHRDAASAYSSSSPRRRTIGGARPARAHRSSTSSYDSIVAPRQSTTSIARRPLSRAFKPGTRVSARLRARRLVVSTRARPTSSVRTRSCVTASANGGRARRSRASLSRTARVGVSRASLSRANDF